VGLFFAKSTFNAKAYIQTLKQKVFQSKVFNQLNWTLITMIKADERQLLHKYLLLELAIKSLQVDYHKLEQFKMKTVFLPMMDSLLKNLRQEYFNLKRELAQKRIRVVGWQPVDEYFSDVQVATAGNDVVLRYANQALKSQVEKLLINHISVALE